jgi:hypothetical protein
MIDDKMFQERVARLNALTAPDAAECCVEEDDGPHSLTFLQWLSYPINGPGLSIIVIYVVVPFLLWAFFMVMPMALQFAGILLLIITRSLVGLSTLWYLTVCIRASGEGQIKAPNVFEFSQDDSFSDWFWQFVRIAVTVSLCLAPAFLLRGFAGVEPAVFWTLLAAGTLMLPMALLAVVMFDGIRALNPVLLVSSMISTFIPYLAVVFAFCVPLALLVGLHIATAKTPDPLLTLLVRAVGVYLLMLAACLLGRFFYTNEEKLRWDV